MTADHSIGHALKLLVAITDRDECEKIEGIFTEKHAHFHFMSNAMGTASSEILKAFGLSGTQKALYLCVETASRIRPLMTAVVERLQFIRPGNGIAFIIPISGISAAVSHMLDEDIQHHKERFEELMDREAERTHEEARYELVVAVINQGFSESLMDSARAAGARGGTVVNARRTGTDEVVKFLGISLQSEKEVVAILIPKQQKKELMQAIVKSCGIRTEARGIVFSMPVEACAGIDASNAD